jgi:hypothetical protein
MHFFLNPIYAKLNNSKNNNLNSKLHRKTSNQNQNGNGRIARAQGAEALRQLHATLGGRQGD